MKALALPFALTPPTLVDLFLAEVSALTFLGAPVPASTVVGLTVCIIVNPFSLHLPLGNAALIYLPISVQINAFPVIDIVLPAPEVDIPFGLGVDAPARPQFFLVDLPQVAALVRVGDLDKVGVRLQGLHKFLLAEIVTPEDLVLGRRRLAPESHQLIPIN